MSEEGVDTAFRESLLRRAIALAGKGVRRGDGGPFGAVVARGDEIVAEGWNQVLASRDPTAHAEVVAIRAASRRLESYHLPECVLYASCEPCPMCFGAALWARVGAVYFAAGREDAATAGFADAWMYDEMAITLERRRLPMAQRLRSEALATMTAWAEAEQRRDY